MFCQAFNHEISEALFTAIEGMNEKNSFDMQRKNKTFVSQILNYLKEARFRGGKVRHDEFFALRTRELMENIDSEGIDVPSKYMKSGLFKLPLILGTFNLIYLIILVTILSIFNSQVDEWELVLWWSVLGFLIDIPLTIVIWKFSLKKIKILIPWKKITKFVISTIIFMMFYYLTSDLILDYDPSIYKFLPLLIIQFVICAVIYLSITYAFDKDTRILFKSLKSEIFH